MRSYSTEHVVETIFFGGGTPSLMDPKFVHLLIEHIKSLWPVSGEIEISLEANPTDGEAERFRAFAEAGVTRLSLGVQALDDEDLKQLGRWHSADDARKAFDAAKSIFDVVSMDLIYGRPGQSADDWGSELAEALSWEPVHVSLYQLTIETGTAFSKAQSRGTLALPPDDDLADLYELSQEMCDDAGLSAYEVSNHSAPGYECRHNLGYWRGQDYVGVGAGAHGRLTIDGQRCATETVRRPNAWREQVEQQGHAVELIEPLAPQAHGVELLLMGLRLSEGISLARCEGVAGVPLAQDRVAHLERQGLVRQVGGRLETTKRGRLVLNQLIEALAP